MNIYIEQFANDNVGIATPSGPVTVSRGTGYCTDEQFPLLERLYGAVGIDEEDIDEEPEAVDPPVTDDETPFLETANDLAEEQYIAAAQAAGELPPVDDPVAEAGADVLPDVVPVESDGDAESTEPETVQETPTAQPVGEVIEHTEKPSGKPGRGKVK